MERYHWGASEDFKKFIRPCMSLQVGLRKADPHSDENELEHSTDSLSKTAFLRLSRIVQSFLRVSDIGAHWPSNLIVRSKRRSRLVFNLT